MTQPQQNSMVAGVGSAIAGAAGGAIGDKMFGKSGTQLGKDQRDYMDSAYGDLNQWEQAGAGQQGAASASEANSSASKIAGMQNKTQENMNTQTNGVNKGIADDQRNQQQPQVDSGVAVNVMEAKKKQAEINNIEQDTKNKSQSQSEFGKTTSDITKNKTVQKTGKFLGETAAKAVINGKEAYSDLKEKASKWKGVFNSSMQSSHAKDPNRSKKRNKRAIQ